MGSTTKKDKRVCSKCLSDKYYAKDLCQNCYNKKRWAENDEFRERQKKKNRDRIRGNPKILEKKRIYYHTVVKNNPETIKNRNKKTREWQKNNKPRINKKRNKRRKENPEKENEANKRRFNRLLKDHPSINKSRKSFNFLLWYWNKAIKKRDDYTCQVCGSKKELEAHHIIYKSIIPELALNLNNGITLCRICNDDVHRMDGNWRSHMDC